MFTPSARPAPNPFCSDDVDMSVVEASPPSNARLLSLRVPGLDVCAFPVSAAASAACDGAAKAEVEGLNRVEAALCKMPGGWTRGPVAAVTAMTAPFAGQPDDEVAGPSFVDVNVSSCSVRGTLSKRGPFNPTRIYAWPAAAAAAATIASTAASPPLPITISSKMSPTRPSDPSSVAVSYVCAGPHTHGRFHPSRASALGLQPGPIYGQLQRGYAVEAYIPTAAALAAGLVTAEQAAVADAEWSRINALQQEMAATLSHDTTAPTPPLGAKAPSKRRGAPITSVPRPGASTVRVVIPPALVRDPPVPGSSFAIIACPTLAHLEALVKHAPLRARLTAEGAPASTNGATLEGAPPPPPPPMPPRLVFHIAPPRVTTDAAFAAWIADGSAFTRGTQHVLLGAGGAQHDVTLNGGAPPILAVAQTSALVAMHALNPRAFTLPHPLPHTVLRTASAAARGSTSLAVSGAPSSAQHGIATMSDVDAAATRARMIAAMRSWLAEASQPCIATCALHQDKWGSALQAAAAELINPSDDEPTDAAMFSVHASSVSADVCVGGATLRPPLNGAILAAPLDVFSVTGGERGPSSGPTQSAISSAVTLDSSDGTALLINGDTKSTLAATAMVQNNGTPFSLIALPSVDPVAQLQTVLSVPAIRDAFVTVLRASRQRQHEKRVMMDLGSSTHNSSPKWQPDAPPLPSSFRLVFTGTSSAVPSKYRNVSGALLRLPAASAAGTTSHPYAAVILDCGEGTLGQLARRFGTVAREPVTDAKSDYDDWDDSMGFVDVSSALRAIRIAWVSHMHADHHLGLIRIICARNAASDASRTAATATTPNSAEHERDPPLLVIGPQRLLTWLLEAARVDAGLRGGWRFVDAEHFLVSNAQVRARDVDFDRDYLAKAEPLATLSDSAAPPLAVRAPGVTLDCDDNACVEDVDYNDDDATSSGCVVDTVPSYAHVDVDAVLTAQPVPDARPVVTDSPPAKRPRPLTVDDADGDVAAARRPPTSSPLSGPPAAVYPGTAVALADDRDDVAASRDGEPASFCASRAFVASTLMSLGDGTTPLRVTTTHVVHCHKAYALRLDVPSSICLETGDERRGRSTDTDGCAAANEGWSMLYSGDTRPCASVVALGRGAHAVRPVGELVAAAANPLPRGISLLLHEATFDDTEDGLACAAAKRHSTAAEALAVARDCEARNVVLTHFSARYPKLPVVGGGDALSTGTVDSSGPTMVVAYDLMTLRGNDMQSLPALLPALHALFAEAVGDDDLEIAA